MQTSYNTSLPAGRAGLRADLTPATMLTRVNASKQQVLVTPSSANSTVYTLTINGVACTITSGGSATAALIATALVSAVNGTSGLGVTATDNTGTLTLVGTLSVPFTVTSTGAGTLTLATQIAGAQQVPFGCLVVRGLDDQSARLPYQSSDVTGSGALGITVQDPTIPTVDSATLAVYNQGRAMNVMRRGRVYVQVEEAVVPGNPVYVRYASGTFTQLGAFRTSADSSSAALLPNAHYDSTAGAQGFAIVDFALS